MSDKLTEKTVKLDTPIMRGKTEITEIVLRKPQSGALRGTRLQAIMDMDVGAMMTVIPRISSPTLTAQEMAELDPADLTAMAVEVVTFLFAEVGACRFADNLTVDDLVADIATIFHWSPSITDVMPLTDVLEWRHKAIQRSGASDE